MHGQLVFPLKPVNDDEDEQLDVERIRQVRRSIFLCTVELPLQLRHVV